VSCTVLGVSFAPCLPSRPYGTVQQFDFEVLEHSVNSPDLASSDCHMFFPLIGALRGRQFTSDQEVKESVHAPLVRQPKKVFFRRAYTNMQPGGLSTLKIRVGIMRNEARVLP
jgi:hypothetical protein